MHASLYFAMANWQNLSLEGHITADYNEKLRSPVSTIKWWKEMQNNVLLITELKQLKCLKINLILIINQ